METDSNTPGTLYLIPTPLGKSEQNNALPPAALEIVRSLEVFMVEQMQSAVRFLQWVGDTTPSYDIDFFQLNKHTPEEEIFRYLEPLKAGRNAGVLSEAGAPGVADPGAKLVRMAHKQAIPVVPLVGPSSILLALMASGFNGQSFTFHGYLPRKSGARKTTLKELEHSSRTHQRTEIFMETPHRNDETLNDALTSLHPTTLLCAAINLTLPDQRIISQRVQEWQQQKVTIGKEPAIYLIYAR